MREAILRTDGKHDDHPTLYANDFILLMNNDRELTPSFIAAVERIVKSNSKFNSRDGELDDFLLFEVSEIIGSDFIPTDSTPREKRALAHVRRLLKNRNLYFTL